MSVLLILGAGGHGKVVADAALEAGKWRDVIFLDDAWPQKDKNGRWDIHGKVEHLAQWKSSCDNAIVAIGNNALRIQMQARLLEGGFELATVVHPSAQISRFAKLGNGSVVFANAVVNADAIIGEGAIINTSATIDHDCCLGIGVHISPGAHIGGGVTIGDFTWVGIGAAVCHCLTIGSDVTIGAGAVVVNDIGDDVKAVGVPARPINK